jgi:hypothetical protein
MMAWWLRKWYGGDFLFTDATRYSIRIENGVATNGAEIPFLASVMMGRSKVWS